jgi:GDP-4-dehydro-6-deoxy-D-mannose reductase
MKVLVTGVTGFAGSHLVDYILAEKPGTEITGIQRWRSRTENIEHFEERPDWIFHLAAQSFVPTSWTAPTESLVTNIIGQLNIFEAVKKLGIKPRIQLACSSEEYGLVLENELPIKETNPLRPLSPYAVSKVGQDMLGYQYWMSFRIPVVRTRGFNHEGPRRGPVFVCSDFAKQIADIEKGRRPPVVRVGNLTARRDFTDVRDVVRAYWLALEKGEPGEVYNIASGRAWTIREMLDLLLGMSKSKIKVEEDPARMRPSDVPVLLGDSSKFRDRTGWSPSIPFEKTIADLLAYWRER